ncbi:MAG: protease SohB, partial [Bdellovibrionaceae bacterium]|nr:protease SohB [Pseudobdellovibrionaceae bacterium]
MSDLLLFTGKLSVLILALSAIALGLLWLIQRTQQMKESIEVTSLSDRFHLNASLLRMASASKKERKSLRKEIENFEAKNQKKPVAYVIDFKGDIKASEAENLGEEVNAILAATSEPTEIVLRLESTGGVVHGYGLAAAQILRLRNAGHKVTICVDKVAASGGYMMACVGHQILASPFAILGSVGVIAQIPNFYRLLQKWDVDYREYTAGEFKRTVSLFGQITEKGEEKFKQQIEETHQLFKEFVH